MIYQLEIVDYHMQWFSRMDQLHLVCVGFAPCCNRKSFAKDKWHGGSSKQKNHVIIGSDINVPAFKDFAAFGQF